MFKASGLNIADDMAAVWPASLIGCCPCCSRRFEDLKDAALRWLTYMENRLDELEPVAVDLEVIEKQVEEIEVGGAPGWTGVPQVNARCVPPVNWD